MASGGSCGCITNKPNCVVLPFSESPSEPENWPHPPWKYLLWKRLFPSLVFWIKIYRPILICKSKTAPGPGPGPKQYVLSSTGAGTIGSTQIKARKYTNIHIREYIILYRITHSRGPWTLQPFGYIRLHSENADESWPNDLFAFPTPLHLQLHLWFFIFVTSLLWTFISMISICVAIPVVE